VQNVGPGCIVPDKAEVELFGKRRIVGIRPSQAAPNLIDSQYGKIFHAPFSASHGCASIKQRLCLLSAMLAALSAHFAEKS